MKKQLSTTLAGALLLLLCGTQACNDQDAPRNQAPVLATGTATVGGRTTATLTGTITFSGETEITECGFLYSTVSTLPEAESSTFPVDPASLPGTCTAALTGLSPNTHYYYCLYASSGYTEVRSGIREFDTAADGVPAFDEVACSGITASTATLQGTLTDDGGYEIVTQGFCYKLVAEGDDETPDQEDNVVNVRPGDATFTATLQNLEPGQTYSVCAYGTNTLGVGYGPAVTFETEYSDVPVPSGITPLDSTNTGITVEAYILSVGSGEVTEAGFCWSAESETPTTDMLHQACTIDAGTGTFSLPIEGLSAETTYHIRAYATNAIGTGYGSVYAYTTGTAQPAVVETVAAEDITDSSATLNGRIVSDGGSEIISRGFYYSTERDDVPASGTRLYSTTEENGFAYALAGLSSSTTYYYCAYAENAGGIATGEVLSFTTASETAAPTVGATTVSGITTNGAVLTAEIVSDEGSDITGKGFCYSSTTTTPTIEDGIAASTADGLHIAATLSGLAAATTYYVRAYAINDGGTGYGSVQSFTTLMQASVPAVGSTSVTGITSSTASASATVIDDGGSEVTEKGFYYGTSNPPTASGTKVVSDASGNAITAGLDGLSPNTRYYIRAFATNSEGTALGATNVFTTADDRTTPTVGSVTASNITDTSVDLSATLIDSGGGEIVEKGFCYTTDATAAPTTANSTTVKATTDGDDISLTLTGLSPVTTYYIRAYASNGAATGYSETLTVITATAGVPGMGDNVSPSR